jgi:hypothetical protein
MLNGWEAGSVAKSLAGGKSQQERRKTQRRTRSIMDFNGLPESEFLRVLR